MDDSEHNEVTHTKINNILFWIESKFEKFPSLIKLIKQQ